jgi:hypothetical protein
MKSTFILCMFLIIQVIQGQTNSNMEETTKVLNALPMPKQEKHAQPPEATEHAAAAAKHHSSSYSSTTQEKDQSCVRGNCKSSNQPPSNILLIGREHPITLDREYIYEAFSGQPTNDIRPENKVVSGGEMK